MKKTLLSLALVFAAFAMYAQCSGTGNCDGSYNGRTTTGTYSTSTFVAPEKFDFTIFPNPTVDFIQIDEKTLEKSPARFLRIYSLTGQLLKNFTLANSNSYNVMDLKPGTYLVQFLDWKRKVIKTRMLNKADSALR